MKAAKKMFRDFKSAMSGPPKLDRPLGGLVVKVQHNIRQKDLGNAIEAIAVYDESGAQEALVKGTDHFPFTSLRPGTKTVALIWRGQPYARKQVSVYSGKTMACRISMDSVPTLYRVYDADLQTPLRDAHVVLHAEGRKIEGRTDYYGEVVMAVPNALLALDGARFLLTATPTGFRTALRCFVFAGGAATMDPVDPLPFQMSYVTTYQPKVDVGLDELYDDFDLDELDALEATVGQFDDDAAEAVLEEELEQEEAEVDNDDAADAIAAALALEMEELADDDEDEGADDDERRAAVDNQVPDQEPDRVDDGAMIGETGNDMVDFDQIGNNADSGMVDFDQIGNNADSGMVNDLPDSGQGAGQNEPGGTVSDPAWL